MQHWSLTKEIRTAYGNIRYDVQGSGPPLVLVHGTPWSSFNWRHLLPALERSYTVYYYDLLGYGQSEKQDGQDVSLGVQNQILVELLDAWGLEAPIIIGHDFGGTTALRAHLLNGRAFQQMILIDPVAVAPWGSTFFTHVSNHMDAFQSIPDFIHEAMTEAYVQGAAYKPMIAETLAGIKAPWLGMEGQHAFYRQMAQADQKYTDEIEPRYGDVSAPALIVWGENDPWIPVDRAHTLHQAIPGSRLELIPGAGHLVQEEAPTHLLACITDFLRGE